MIIFLCMCHTYSQELCTLIIVQVVIVKSLPCLFSASTYYYYYLVSRPTFASLVLVSLSHLWRQSSSLLVFLQSVKSRRAPVTAWLLMLWSWATLMELQYRVVDDGQTVDVNFSRALSAVIGQIRRLSSVWRYISSVIAQLLWTAKHSTRLDHQ